MKVLNRLKENLNEVWTILAGNLSQFYYGHAGTIREEDLRRTTQLIYHFHEGEEFHTLCRPRDLFQQRQWYKDRSSLPLWCVALCNLILSRAPILRIVTLD